mgnify:CR=1 FL=1
MILCLLPSTRSLDAYGRVLRPDDVAEYPEAGPGGRYGPGSRAPERGAGRPRAPFPRHRLGA